MDLYIKIGFLGACAILIGAFVLAYANFGGTENLLVVHFDAYRGIDFLGSKADVFGIVGSSAAMLLINFWLAYIFYGRDRFFSYILTGVTVFLSLLILITILGIISIN